MIPKSIRNDPQTIARIVLVGMGVVFCFIVFLIVRQGDDTESTASDDTNPVVAVPIDIVKAYGFSSQDEVLTVYEVDAATGATAALPFDLSGFIAETVSYTADGSVLVNLETSGSSRFPVVVAHPEGTRTLLDSATNNAISTSDGTQVVYLEGVAGTVAEPTLTSIAFFYPGDRNAAGIPITKPIPTSVVGYNPDTKTLVGDDGQQIDSGSDASQLRVDAELVDFSPSGASMLIRSGSAYWLVDFATGDPTEIDFDGDLNVSRVVFAPSGNLRVITTDVVDGFATYADIDASSFDEVGRGGIEEQYINTYPALVQRNPAGNYALLTGTAEGGPAMQLFDALDAPGALVPLDRALTAISV
jgi:hypothetical protein